MHILRPCNKHNHFHQNQRTNQKFSTCNNILELPEKNVFKKNREIYFQIFLSYQLIIEPQQSISKNLYIQQNS